MQQQQHAPLAGAGVGAPSQQGQGQAQAQAQGQGANGGAITVAGPRYDPAAVGFVGGGPSFPGTDGLLADAFKVVVASWRRLNPDTTSTSDFAVDVTTYAPKLPFVKRVQLIDAQIPSTQRLIEDEWCRLWFAMGFTPTPGCRRLDLEAWPAGAPAPMSTRVVLPLPIDAVLAAIPNVDGRAGVTRIVLASAAPYPVQAMVAAWTDMPCGGRLVLAGAPLPTTGALGLTLTKDMVMDADAGPNAFDVLSYPLAAALVANTSSPLQMTLLATVVWSDESLARAITWAGTMALQTLCSRAAADCQCSAEANAQLSTVNPGASPSLLGATTGTWLFRLSYVRPDDRFVVQYSAPRLVAPDVGPPGALRVLAVDSLATYLGLDSVPLPRSGASLRAPAPRQQPRMGYARVPCGNYTTPGALAAAVAAAASAYTWPSLKLNITPAGGPPVAVVVRGGQALLSTVARKLQDGIAAALPSHPGIVVNALKFGLQFQCVVGPGVPIASAFAIEFPEVSPEVGARLGYAPATPTAYATRHDPLCCLAPHHVPEWCEGVLASMDLSVVVTPCGGLALRPQPFAPFPMLVSAPVGSALGVWVASPPPGSLQLVGLQPGAPVTLVGPSGSQTPCVVTDADPVASSLHLLQLDGTVTPADLPHPGGPYAVTVVPTGTLQGAPHCAPLILYMQTAGTLVDREAPLPAVVLGFQPTTYVALPGCGIDTPGTVRTRCDPYVVLCLSFLATDATAMTGNVYYPFEVPAGGSQLVFAQVLRCNADFRTDYDRVFTHSFPGAGVHLGYIRVRLLNADGSPYITHGHPVTVCLRMDVAGDSISMGGPGHMTLLQSNC